MPLVPCDSCRRHVRAADPACPFCKVTRTPSALVAVAASALIIAGCDTFSPASKYGGPPPGYNTPENTTTVTTTPPDAAVEAPVAPAPSTTGSSPRLSNSSSPDNDRVIAPVAKYGGPPRR